MGMAVGMGVSTKLRVCLQEPADGRRLAGPLHLFVHVCVRVWARIRVAVSRRSIQSCVEKELGTVMVSFY